MGEPEVILGQVSWISQTGTLLSIMGEELSCFPPSLLSLSHHHQLLHILPAGPVVPAEFHFPANLIYNSEMSQTSGVSSTDTPQNTYRGDVTTHPYI